MRYECLLFICLYCGCIGHILRHCEIASLDLSDDEKGYGVWMQAELENSVLAEACSMSVDMDWFKGGTVRHVLEVDRRLRWAQIGWGRRVRRGAGP